MPGAPLAASVFLGYLVSVVVTHTLWNRLLPSERPPQGRGLLAVLGNIGPWLLVGYRLAGADSEPIAFVLYLMICLPCAGYCYWSLICLSESGRRYRIAWLVHTGEAPTADALARIYDRDCIVRERLRRLELWGEIRLTLGRFRCQRGKMFWASVAVHAWARILGFRWF